MRRLCGCWLGLSWAVGVGMCWLVRDFMGGDGEPDEIGEELL